MSTSRWFACLLVALVILLTTVGCSVLPQLGLGPSPTPLPPVAPTETGVPTVELQPTAVPVSETPTPQPPTATPMPPTPTQSVPAGVPSPVAPLPTPELFDEPADALHLLASYFNAVNRKEYRRAYDYWDTPPNASYEDFAAGYGDTASVLLVLSPPTRTGAAAGSTYVGIPALLLATHTDGSQHNYVACYVVRSPNPALTGAAGPVWSLYNAQVSATPGNGSDATLLANACEALIPTHVEMPFDDRTTPERLLASYFNAVNLKEYRRAYGYWETPPDPSFEQFAQGYADTAAVLLAVSAPTRIGGAAGSMYADIPTLLVATHTDGSQHVFVGCYVARRPNPAMVSGPDPGWSLYSANVNPAPANSADAQLLATACLP